MTTLQIAVLLGIICMMSGAGMILGTGLEATKKDNRQIARAKKVLTAPVLYYEPVMIDNAEVVDMVQTDQKMIGYQTRL